MLDRSVSYPAAARTLLGIAAVSAVIGFAAGSWATTIDAAAAMGLYGYRARITFTATPGVHHVPTCGQEIAQ